MLRAWQHAFEPMDRRLIPEDIIEAIARRLARNSTIAEIDPYSPIVHDIHGAARYAVAGISPVSLQLCGRRFSAACRPRFRRELDNIHCTALAGLRPIRSRVAGAECEEVRQKGATSVEPVRIRRPGRITALPRRRAYLCGRRKAPRRARLAASSFMAHGGPREISPSPTGRPSFLPAAIIVLSRV
jgi:hypothetical protein